MARRRKGSPVHGWVVLDKPKSVTSTQAVSRVRRLFDAQKAGHAGTLDPMATGVLAIALGEATKTVPYAMEGDKLYRFTARWGEATATDDAEGAVTGEADHRRIFDRFFRTDDARAHTKKGTGLGLAICLWIVESHKGRIDVKSEPGHGSTFTIVLPLSPRTA